MIGGNPGSLLLSLDNIMRPTHPQETYSLLPSSSSSSSSTTSSSSSSSLLPQFLQSSNIQTMAHNWHDNQLPESWSQLLMGGLIEEEDKCSFTPFQTKKLENWQDQLMYQSANAHSILDTKQESVLSNKGYVYGQANEEIQVPRSSWSQTLHNSSPKSCVTTSLNCSMLDFSNSNVETRHQQLDHSSQECNSTPTGSPYKKARVQASSAKSTFMVRKEKLGDRITTLHQLVSPFGKTDTASVLLEAIGYIRFLQSQIEALSSPYLTAGSASNMNASDGIDQEPKKDLRSRGLCLVPVSFTLHVGSENGADYWVPTFGG